MFILGINAYHGGASACLIQDGKLIAAVEEERFNRQKYWAGFPVQAIQFCLSEANITPYDLDHVGISRNPSANLHKKILYALRRRPNFDYMRDRVNNMARVRDVKSAFIEGLHLNESSVRSQFHNIEHHRAHMASAFFVSPFENAAILSVDGMGDFVSTMWGSGRGNHIDVMGAVNFPHSLGYFYTLVTQWLGFPKYGDEGKVMGLAGYGQPKYLDKVRDIIRIQRDGSFELNTDYLALNEGFSMTWENGSPVLGTMFSKKFVNEFGEPRTPGSELTQYHMDVTASLQEMLEEAEFALLKLLHKKTGSDTLCLAGGVALNSVFNGKIRPQTPFKEIFIQPAAGDAGTALGVAYFIYHQILGKPRSFVMRDAYTGPRFVNGRVTQTLRQYELKHQELDQDTLCEETAKLIAQGNIVGWFQGAAEWGPRALGNRSILADPRRGDMKDTLNARIKHREKFRPFAPSILLEETGKYFDQEYPDPFMIKVYNILPEKHAEIPAVTHIDGTGRLQTVEREATPLYWQVISAFHKETGVPIVLNTSFNENEPIVCTPEEAVECFLRTKMDALVMGDFLVKKETSP
jgi:carbamoyltransferase